MKRGILLLISLLPLLAACDIIDSVRYPEVTEMGKNYVWCQMDDCNYLKDGLSVTLNPAGDTVYFDIKVQRVYGFSSDIELKSLEMRVAFKDLEPQRRLDLDNEQVRVSYTSASTPLWASDVSGYVMFWKCAGRILSGQFEFQCSAATRDFYISHGIFDLKAPFVL